MGSGKTRNALDRETQMHRFEIQKESDIVATRSAARGILTELGCSVIDKTRIATAVSELARNVLVHGGGGYVEMKIVEKEGVTGLRCVFVDDGPGINDLSQAMESGFSTGGSMGSGLPGSRNLVDVFHIDSQAGQGTRVEIIKWV